MSSLDADVILTELREMRKERAAADASLHGRITELQLAMAAKPCGEHVRRLNDVEANLARQGDELSGLKSFAWKVGLVAGAIGTVCGYAASWLKSKFGVE